MNYRVIIIAVIVAFLIGGYVGDELRPQPERPFLKFLARAAKVAMWVMIMEEAPQQHQRYQAVSADADHVDHARSL